MFKFLYSYQKYAIVYDDNNSGIFLSIWYLKKYENINRQIIKAL